MQLILGKNQKLKKLLIKKHQNSGRNNKGSITVAHKGGGKKQKFRLIEFTKFIWNSKGIIQKIEYDPNRTSLINLLIYSQGIICYNLKIEKTYIGDIISTVNKFIHFSGWSSYLNNFQLNSILSQIEYYYFNKSQYCKSAGAFCILLKKKEEGNLIKLKSKKIKIFKKWNIGTLGKIQNIEIKKKKYKKAGHKRNIGIRPTTRGVAMNPVDHPHGGGEGKSSGGRSSVSPWGKITKGLKTQKKWKKKKVTF